MKGSNNQASLVPVLFLGMTLIATLGLTGCQVEAGGQTIPSPYYMTDDVQYFPHGAEFKLAQEAAALKAASQEQTPRR
jgi:hypothetical protein